jgi:O-antigen ligase
MLSFRKFCSRVTISSLQQWGLYAVLFSISLFRLGRVITGSAALAPVKLFTAFTYMLWMTDVVVRKNKRSVGRVICNETSILIFFMFVINLLSLVNARYFDEVNIGELFERFKVMSAYFIIVAVVKDRRVLRMAVLIFILGSLLTSFVGLYELTTGDAFFNTSYRFGVVAQTHAEGLRQTQFGGAGRVQGLVSDAGLHSYTIIVYMGIILPWVFYARTRIVRGGALAFLLVGFLNLIGTGTRSAWLAWVIAVGVFFVLLKYRHKVLLLIAGIIGAAAVFLFLAMFPHIPTLERLHTKGNASLSWRADTFRQALEMVRDHPFLGVGTGNYLNEYHNYLADQPALSRYFFGWLHNSYLQIWAENGTIGLLVFLGILLSLAIGLLHAHMKAGDQEMRAITLGLLVALTGHCGVFFAMPIIYQEFGGLIMGLSVAAIGVARQEAMTAEAEV